MLARVHMALAAIVAFLLCVPGTSADNSSDTVRFVKITSQSGGVTYVPDDRRPSLYTQDFGDCLGGSSITLDSYNAAYYQDNMTVVFHFSGYSGLNNASLMMYIGVYAYGESRFDLIFNPCSANIRSLCPLNSSTPITASGIIPISESDIAGIPTLAYSIPDFEGQAILRVFDNATEEEIACYSGVITNGNSFSQPAAVSSALGAFTAIALLASFATAIYGEAVPTMRLHYAHSLSVGVVFAVFQHIFFTGALSVNWPSVLVAWWSNFAWAGGMIYTSSMQNSINKLIGNNIGNTTEVGAAQSGSTQASLGGGYDISAIYKRSSIYQREPLEWIPRDHRAEGLFERALRSRADAPAPNPNADYTWFGTAVGPGFPLPGNFSGFAGTLAEENILVSNAFMTGFLWFLILLGLVIVAVVALKWTLEALAIIRCIKQDRLRFFRDHWLGYTVLAALRTCLIAFFMMMFLTIFEFTYSSSGGVKAVAAIVFIIFFFGIFGAAAYAVYYKGAVAAHGAQHQVERKMLLGRLPWFGVKKAGPSVASEPVEIEAPADGKSGAIPTWKRMPSSGSVPAPDGQIMSIHDSDDYTTKFGWLAARFRRSRWWFFAAWIFYDFLRAIFLGGASGYALAQVFGLLAIEVIAFAFILWARPFEGQRLNLLVVYCLGFSKVATVALSAAFDVRFNLDRIIATVLGIVIIVIQGILTIITLIAIVVGAFSSYMSISRNREEFRPRKMHGLREKYFDHLDRTVNDLPADQQKKPKKEKKKKTPVIEEEPTIGFEIQGVRRMAKIEDEDAEFMPGPNASNVSVHGPPRHGTSTPARSRPTSIASYSVSNLPYGARAHRMSWSARDVDAPSLQREAQEHWSTVDLDRATQNISSAATASASPARSPSHSRGPSRSVTMPAAIPLSEGVKAQISHDSLNVGGDVSTRDMIGKVPAPSMRPRAGTHGSRNSRSSFTGFIPEESNSNDVMISSESSRDGSKRASMGGRAPIPLTPAQEMDEWGANLTPNTSRQG